MKAQQPLAQGRHAFRRDARAAIAAETGRHAVDGRSLVDGLADQRLTVRHSPYPGRIFRQADSCAMDGYADESIDIERALAHHYGLGC